MKSKDMSNQREWSLHDLPGEVRELKDRMEHLLPSYLAGLERLCQLPEEFNRRFWVSCLEALLAKVKTNYQKYQTQAQSADFMAKFATLTMDIALKAGGMEPVVPPESPRVGISLSPTGTIEPDLLNYPQRRPDAILLTLERFETVAQRLGGEIMKGTVVPENEGEIGKLIYDLALNPQILPEQHA